MRGTRDQLVELVVCALGKVVERQLFRVCVGGWGVGEGLVKLAHLPMISLRKSDGLVFAASDMVSEGKFSVL